MSTVLDQDPLWREALRIASAARENAGKLPDDERWGMVSKMYFYGTEIVGEAAAGVGAIDPRDVKINLGRLREQLHALKGMYIYGHKTGLLQLDPEEIVHIDTLVADIDDKLKDIPANIEKWYAAQEPPIQKRSVS